MLDDVASVVNGLTTRRRSPTLPRRDAPCRTLCISYNRTTLEANAFVLLGVALYHDIIHLLSEFKHIAA